MAKMTRRRKTYWLSYGGGVNSTALAIMLVRGKLPNYTPFRVLFADTQDEIEGTYDYIFRHFMPWLRKNGHTLEITRDCEGVLERWERLSVTGSRLFRECSNHAKIQPINRHIDAEGLPEDEHLLGIHVEESHRATLERANERKKNFPLVELEIDQAGCEEIILAEGLPVPPKSGCWHCPFKKTKQIIELVITDPCKFERIAALEKRAHEFHETDVCHWEKPASYWRNRANGVKDGSQDSMYQDEIDDDATPCSCID
jgi:3'-phosphoadenosine 5'-phosphosulfate sulfotransferase (PAPS reductase)/FAD synthetase